MKDLNASNSQTHIEHRSSKLQWQYGIAKQLSDLWNNDIDPEQLYNNMESPKNPKHGQFALPLQRIQHLFKSEPWCSMNPMELAQHTATNLPPSGYIEKVVALGSFVNFAIPRSTFTEAILQQITDDGAQYGFDPSYSNRKNNDTSVVISCDLPMLPLFLDPNHYRGLVLATFLQRSYRHQGQKVRLINTMTTWNVEFGYLALAVSKYGLYPTSGGKDLLIYLNHIYHQIKQAASKDGTIEESAQKYLLDLEKGDNETTKLWKQMQDTMIKEYQALFTRRLFIDFDELLACTTPADSLNTTYDLLEQCDELVKTETGEWKMDLAAMGLGTPLLRNSKGISTQLTRDIAQLIEQERIMANQDYIEYHIAGQHLTRHIQQLYHIITKLNLSSSQKSSQQRYHVDFGKVKLDAQTTTDDGFSVLHCLDSLQQTMLEIMEENEGTEKYDAMMAQLGQLSATTKNKMMSDRIPNESQHMHNDGNDDNSSDSSSLGVSIVDLAKQHADKLGVCTMIAHQFAQRRSKPMVFSTSSPPDVFGNSGVFLQYVHSRLCGIERQLFKRGLLLGQQNGGGDGDNKGNTYGLPTSTTLGMGQLLYQQEAFDVVDVMTQFPRMMQQSQLAKDPSILVTYLFKLARTANQSLYRLRIKDMQKDLALARWTLFWAAKQTLANGLTALGIDPVNRI